MLLQTHFPSALRSARHVTLHHLPSPAAVPRWQGERRGLPNQCFHVCAGEFRDSVIICLFLWRRSGRGAQGLFIIPLTSWIRAGIIIRSMNIHEARVCERERGRLTVTNRQTGSAQTLLHMHTHSQSCSRGWTTSERRDFKYTYDIKLSQQRYYNFKIIFRGHYKSILFKCLTFFWYFMFVMQLRPWHVAVRAPLKCSFNATMQHVITLNWSNSAAWSVALSFKLWRTNYPSSASVLVKGSVVKLAIIPNIQSAIRLSK